MNRDREFYTELIYKHKCMEDFGPRVISVREEAWDLGGEQMVEMFRTIMVGMSFSEEAFERSLAAYLEERGYNVYKDETEHESNEDEEEE